MTGWRGVLVAIAAGGLVLAAGFVIPRLGAGSGTDAPTDEDPTGVVLMCEPAIAPACEAAAEVIGIDARPWTPQATLPDRYVVVAAEQDLPDDVEAGPVVMRSPIVIAVWLDRLSILQLECGRVDFDCLGRLFGSEWSDIGGDPAWGDIALGLADPTSSTAGLAAWAAVTADATPFEVSQSLFLVSRNDAALAADAVLRRSSADVLVTTEAAVAAQLENAIGRGGRIEIVYPERSAWVEYVAVRDGFGSAGVVEDLLTAEVGAAIASAGARPVTQPPPGSYPDGMGEPGVAEAVPSPQDRGTLVESWDRVR